MQEKDMVLDILNGAKSSLGNYAKVISESQNQQLRQTLQNMRNCDEKFQYDLYTLASQKGYYPKPEEVSSQEISMAKSTMTQESTSRQGAGPIPNIR